MNKHSGFTLVEIGIVLFIITLILGTILLNSGSVIGNAKTTDTVALVKDLTVAISDFKSRYHYLPGDIPQAGDTIPGISAACNIATTTASIGNGRIDTNAEIGCVAEHLVQANLIKGSKSGTQYVIYSRNATSSNPDVAVLTRSQGQNTTFPTTVQNVIEIINLPCETAIGLDSKMDDGNFATGNIRASIPTCIPGSTTDLVPYLDFAL